MKPLATLPLDFLSSVMIRYIATHIQTSNTQLLPVDDDWVRGCLVTVATTFFVTAAANRDGRGEREEESS